MASVGLVVVPDRNDPDCAELYVHGTLAGRPYRFLLDTGAARSQLVADPFLLTHARQGSHASRGAFGQSRDATLVELPELAVGPIEMSSLVATLVAADEPGAQSLIGMDVLRTHCCDFRFSSAELRVGETSPDASWLPLHLDAAAHPYVELRWPGIRADAVWDTGAGVTVVDLSFYREHPELFSLCGTSLGTDATGAQVAADMAVLAGPAIGGSIFRAHRVAVVDLAKVNQTLDRPMDFILGYTTLSQADWQFDFPAGRWSVVTHDATASVSLAHGT